MNNNAPNNKIIFIDSTAARTSMHVIQKISKTQKIEQQRMSNNNSRSSDLTDSLGNNSGQPGVYAQETLRTPIPKTTNPKLM
jgi:hypothetical protein